MKIKRILEPLGIVDIGSNSIRLCVYDAGNRVPVPLFNEKAVCGLALGLGSTGRLNPEGFEQALATVGRFAALARAMEVKELDVLATAAVRDADDGPAFVRELARRHRVQVKTLSGGQEACLAAMGVLCGTPEAEGIVCDLGGGSLELIGVKDGQLGDHVTMPLGLLRLAESSGDDRAVAASIIDAHLSRVDWLSAGEGGTVYAVGGAWRALARLFIAQTRHPLTVLDNFALDARDARQIVDLIANQSRRSLDKVPGVSRKRLTSLPLAAQVMDRILVRINPHRLAFSIYGMREGQFFKRLPEKTRRENPLLSVCRQIAQMNGRFPTHGDELMRWMDPLFPDETAQQTRIRHAACLVSDAFWGEHPDYRAEQAFLRMLRLPFMGVEHAERAAIALTVFVRYQGDEENPQVQRAIGLLDETAVRRCRKMGSALRLAHTLTGGATALLKRTRLIPDGRALVLEVPAGAPAFVLDPDRALDRLAKAMDFDSWAMRGI